MQRILLKQTNQIAVLSLKNPPVNTLTLELLGELRTALSSPYRGLLLKSDSARVFSAGLDLKYLIRQPQESDADLEVRLKEYMGTFQDCVKLLAGAQYPTVALVRGAAPAGGTVLSLCCDYRVGSGSALTMGLTEVAVGMAPPQWVHELAANTLGKHVSNRFLQLGLTATTPQNVLKYGFVNELNTKFDQEDPEIEEKEMMDRGMQVINEYNALPPVARADAKSKLNANVLRSINQDALHGVYKSISGKEFQDTAVKILASLSNRKK